MDKDWNAKLSDFGFARQGPTEGISHVSTAVSDVKNPMDPICFIAIPCYIYILVVLQPLLVKIFMNILDSICESPIFVI